MWGSRPRKSLVKTAAMAENVLPVVVNNRKKRTRLLDGYTDWKSKKKSCGTKEVAHLRRQVEIVTLRKDYN